MIGTHTPLILIVIGEPTEKNRSEACFSAIRLNMRSRDIGLGSFLVRLTDLGIREEWLPLFDRFGVRAHTMSSATSLPVSRKPPAVVRSKPGKTPRMVLARSGEVAKASASERLPAACASACMAAL